MARVSAPLVLVPGFWLGAWAWDEVAAHLRAAGHDVTALTLPGLGPDHPDRGAVRIAEHVDAVAAAVADAADRTGQRVVLVLHSGAGFPGYAATDRVADRLAAVVYVDSGPGTGALGEGFPDAEHPLPSWEELEAEGSSLAGLSPQQRAEFRRRAVPEPGAALREAPPLGDGSRRGVPTTVVCCSMTSQQVRDLAAQGAPFLAGLAELEHLAYVDLPTGHWPMWSRPGDLAELLARTASGG